MKLKFWSFEYEFDRNDAKIVVPTILLLVALVATSVNPILLIVLAAIYYFLYFYLADLIQAFKNYMLKLKMRRPHCKNRKIILQGYDTYESDEHHAYYFCDTCKTTAILTEGGLLEI